MSDAFALTLATVIGVLASGGILTALWAWDCHRAAARARRAQADLVCLDCTVCGRHHGAHFRHDDGRVTCCLCGGLHPSTGTAGQQEDSDGS